MSGLGGRYGKGKGKGRGASNDDDDDDDESRFGPGLRAALLLSSDGEADDPFAETQPPGHVRGTTSPSSTSDSSQSVLVLAGAQISRRGRSLSRATQNTTSASESTETSDPRARGGGPKKRGGNPSGKRPRRSSSSFSSSSGSDGKRRRRRQRRRRNRSPKPARVTLASLPIAGPDRVLPRDRGIEPPAPLALLPIGKVRAAVRMWRAGERPPLCEDVFVAAAMRLLDDWAARVSRAGGKIAFAGAEEGSEWVGPEAYARVVEALCESESEGESDEVDADDSDEEKSEKSEDGKEAERRNESRVASWVPLITAMAGVPVPDGAARALGVDGFASVEELVTAALTEGDADYAPPIRSDPVARVLTMARRAVSTIDWQRLFSRVSDRPQGGSKSRVRFAPATPPPPPPRAAAADAPTRRSSRRFIEQQHQLQVENAGNADASAVARALGVDENDQQDSDNDNEKNENGDDNGDDDDDDDDDESDDEGNNNPPSLTPARPISLRQAVTGCRPCIAAGLHAGAFLRLAVRFHWHVESTIRSSLCMSAERRMIKRDCQRTVTIGDVADYLQIAKDTLQS